MSFEFKARVLLELGAELISSDAIALYELVKNSLDAGSPSVVIDIKIGMQHSAFQQFIEILTEYQRQEEAGEDSDFSAKEFNEAVFGTLEENATEWSRSRFAEAYGEPGTAKEAITNLRAAYGSSSRIFVKDTGDGMSLLELKQNYLTVGTPERLHEKQKLIHQITGDSSRLHFTKTNQKLPLGEKGIGRLSAMRLGHLVKVKTKIKKNDAWNWLTLDWRPAFIDPTLSATDPILDFHPTRKTCTPEEVNEQGTTIYMRDLQGDWSKEKIQRIATADLAKLADPFASLRANKFITVRYQDEPVTVPSMDREPLKSCDAIVEAQFRYDNDYEPELTMRVEYKTLSREKTDRLTGDHLRACVREEPTAGKKNKTATLLLDAEIVGRALKHLGPWEMKFYWFNRGRIRTKNREIWDNSVRGFLEQWGGGFLVYRDGYRVYPYGERSDDWLDLDRKALAGGAFKLNRAQIVGYLRISSIANPLLLDQTNREGFRDSADKEALRRLLRYVIIGFCRPFLEEVERSVQPPLDVVVAEVERQISTSREVAVTSLRGISSRVPDESRNVATVMHHLEEVSEAWERAKLRIANFDKEIEGYIHLAGVGLMLEFIAHELARVTQDTLKAVISGKLSPEVVEAQLRTLEKRVRILDELSIPGRQIRKQEDIASLVGMLVDFHQAKAQRHAIDITLSSPSSRSSWKETLEKGQFLQILDNLLSNSFYWLKNRLDQSQRGSISIVLDQRNREVRVSDNGVGIPLARKDSIFSQFVTTKPPREGRGLGLYIARRLAEDNGATLDLADPDTDGMYRTFVISFGKN